MLKRLAVVAVLPVLSACGLAGLGGDEFRAALPKDSAVRFRFPGAEGQALTGDGVHREPLLGQKAEYYTLTRGVTVAVNGGTLWTLGVARAVTKYPPTSVDLTTQTAVWGPHTEALSPNTFKFTVKKLAAHAYSYSLEGKGKTEPDANYRVVLSGTHTIATDASGQELEGYGEGSFTADWDKYNQLPENTGVVGKAVVQYKKLSATVDGTITAQFKGVKDATSSQLVDANYSYIDFAAGGGEFEFSLDKNVDAKPAAEHLTIKSRWQQSGAGRSDVKAAGGDLGASTSLTGSECWDANFGRLFLEQSWSPASNEGASGGCAFAQPSYSTL